MDCFEDIKNENEWSFRGAEKKTTNEVLQELKNDNE